MDETRRTIAELVTRYQLEPSLRDVYVEGPFDASFIAWFLESGGISDVAVYAITTVDVPAGVLDKHGLTLGEKQRLIAFAREIVAVLDDSGQVTCIVDADLDYVFERVLAEHIVLLTDYPSIEAYLFQRELLAQWLSVTARLNRSKVSEVIDSLPTLLSRLFLARCASLSLGWRMTWISVDAGVNKTKHGYVFDSQQFIDRLLQRNGRTTQRADFLTEVEALRGRLRRDPRHAMHGHDFVDLLTIAVRRASRQRWLHSADAVLGSLAGAVRRESLENEPLFRALSARVRAQ